MLRIIIPTVCGYLVQKIDPEGKSCLGIQAGRNRREASSIVAGGFGGRGTICTGDQLYVHRAK